MKAPKIIDMNMFAPCGMNCAACYKHLKDKKPCKGCLGTDDNKPKHCVKCPIKNCAIDKGIIYCYFCEEFPCKRLKNMEKIYNKRYNVSLIDNAKRAKKLGIIGFLEADVKSWTCDDCGGVISLHDKICSECKKVIEND